MLPLKLYGGYAKTPVSERVSFAEVRSAVITAGTVAVEELKYMPEGATYAETLSAQWQSRLRAMDGLVDYADALQSIVAAGRQGASSVGALADSVSQLAAVAGIVFPPAEAAETVVRWGLAHNNLVLAVQERRPVSTQSLVQAAVDLRDLIQRIRTL